LIAELFRIVLSSKNVNGSMKFKFFHKIAIIHEKFLVIFYPAPRDGYIKFGGRIWAAGCASLMFVYTLCPDEK